ncbi:MAG: hypothetical protein FWD73_02730 [Polyangiaceae bacterium]|nr:hypothetical protein [Polyangiaceae bacterium]
MNDRFPCPCCGFLTQAMVPLGLFDSCPVCYWADDPMQAHYPDSAGANAVSLNVAKKNFATFGASEERFRGEVRAPTPDEIP